MKGEITIDNWTEVVQNADQENLPPDKMTVCKNLRPVPGKLVKTQGAGIKLNAVRDGMKNLVTYIESNISGGSLYIAMLINESTKIVSWYAWNGAAWTLIQNVFPQFAGNGTSWFHRHGKNPIIQNSNILRFLPGNVGKADGTNESKGLWLGRIDRDYFDELYSPSAAFYNYDCPVEKPDISFAITQHPGDKAFSPAESGIPITDLSTTNHTVTIAGDYVSVLSPGELFKIENNPDNDGKYIVERSALVSNQTVIKIDTSHSDLVGDTNKQGTVRFVVEKDTRYYKVSYIYDGIQESLLSEPVRIEFDGERFLRLSFDIVKANHNNRITALNVYRSNSLEGSYRKIHTIDFLRKSGNFWSNSSGAYPGLGSVYVPELADFDFNGAKYYKLWVRISDIEHASVGTFQASGQSESNTLISSTARTYAGKDLWNVSWYLQESADGNPPWTTVLSGEDDAYAGEQTVIVGENTGEHDTYGGVFRLHGAANASITEAATAGSGNQTKFTTQYNHKLAVGDIVTLSGFTPEVQYNGIFKVIKVDDATHFTVNVQFGADDTGKWCYGREERIADNNYKRAIHLNDRYNGADNDLAWTLTKVAKGLFYVKDGDTITVYFYDTGLSEGAEHPLAGEVSIKVNGRFARLIGNRLFQANLVLDPGGDKEEIHEDWASYTPLLQYDVNPVSNIFTLPDLEGGACTGLVDIGGNPVVFKPHAFTLINISDAPGTPSSWSLRQSPHNIGNIAEEGCLEALGKVYFVYYNGIYQITPSAFVEGAVETEDLKISWPIDNIFNAMTDEQKEAVKAVYNQRRGEVVFTITFTKQSTDYHQKWAYNTSTGGWRELGTERKFDLMALDEKANVMIFDDDTDKVYSLAIADSEARSTLRIPVFRVTDDRPRPIRWVYVTYICASDQALRLYTEHSTEALEEFILPATDKIITKRIRINRRAKKASLEITEDFSGYVVTKETEDSYGYLIIAKEGGINPNTELHKIRILGDFDQNTLRG